nr:hypothetical protein [Tanacetum cinerariifolium]
MPSFNSILRASASLRNDLDGFCSLCNSRNSCVYDPNSNSFDCPPDSYHPPHPTYETYSGDSCGNDSHFGYDCPPRFPLNYEPKPGYIQNYNSYPHDPPSFPQQYPCCEDCGVTHEAYQCRPMNEDYYHKQNSFYDSTFIGFDQAQPQQYIVNHLIFYAHNDYLDSQKKLSITLTKLMEQATSLILFCKMACQIVQKKQEEKRIEEEQVAKAQNWKLPVCYDDDDDEERSNSLKDNIISGLPLCAAITPNEPVDSLSMGDEHLETIPAMESDEFIKSSVENLVPILSESEGIPDTMCDVHLVNNPTPLEAKDHFEIVINFNDDYSSSDDDSLYNENIEYVEIEDDNLYEKLLNVNLLIAKIEALKDNPTPSSEFLTKSSSTSSKSFLVETNTFDNSLPKFENFCFDLEEISSGSTTTYSDISLLDYEAFYFFDDHIKEISSGSTTTHSDISLSEYDSFILDISNDQFPPTDRSDFTNEEFADELAHIISLPYDCFYFRDFPDPVSRTSFQSQVSPKNIKYVEASPHDSELVSLEVAKIVILKDEEIEDDNLREKLLNVNLLIAKIEALKDNPTPSFESLTKSSSTSPKSFLEETNTFDNSLPE